MHLPGSRSRETAVIPGPEIALKQVETYEYATDRESESAAQPRRSGTLRPHLGGVRQLPRSLRLFAPGPDRLARLYRRLQPAGRTFRHGARLLRSGQRDGIRRGLKTDHRSRRRNRVRAARGPGAVARAHFREDAPLATFRPSRPGGEVGVPTGDRGDG